MPLFMKMDDREQNRDCVHRRMFRERPSEIDNLLGEIEQAAKRCRLVIQGAEIAPGIVELGDLPRGDKSGHGGALSNGIMEEALAEVTTSSIGLRRSMIHGCEETIDRGEMLAGLMVLMGEHWEE